MKKEKFTLIRNLTFMLFITFIALCLVFAIFIAFTFSNKVETISDLHQEQINTNNSKNNIRISK